MDITGKKVLVIGMGLSGVAAVDLIKKKGGFPTAYDAKEKKELPAVADLLQANKIPGYWGTNPEIKPGSFDYVIPSPVVKRDMELLQQADAAGIPVISEVELAYQLKDKGTQFAAITGTNGKTTTTSLLHFMFDKAGKTAVACGNIGTAVSSVIMQPQLEWAVAETSSFQLENAVTFRPKVAGILNVTPDHLDRHKTMEAYIDCKAKIFQCQTPEDTLLLNYEDEKVRALADRALSHVVFFSTRQELPAGVFVHDGNIVVRENGQDTVIAPRASLYLRGEHNLENALCAVGMAYYAGLSPEVIAASLAEFKGVPHRIEEVARINDVLYINDSKGTNPASTIKALEAFTEPILLIAGGYDKKADFTEIAGLMVKKCRKLILMGKTRRQIEEAVLKAGFAPENIVMAESMDEAVKKGAELSNPGDVVLLSPACASWDMFDNFEQRGHIFAQAVRNLTNQ